MTKAARAEGPQVKTLNGLNMVCEVHGCGRPAGFLFRTGRGPISALCDYHAAESALRQGIELPEHCEKVLRAGWQTS